MDLQPCPVWFFASRRFFVQLLDIFLCKHKKKKYPPNFKIRRIDKIIIFGYLSCISSLLICKCFDETFTFSPVLNVLDPRVCSSAIHPFWVISASMWCLWLPNIALVCCNVCSKHDFRITTDRRDAITVVDIT